MFDIHKLKDLGSDLIGYCEAWLWKTRDGDIYVTDAVAPQPAETPEKYKARAAHEPMCLSPGIVRTLHLDTRDGQRRSDCATPRRIVLVVVEE